MLFAFQNKTKILKEHLSKPDLNRWQKIPSQTQDLSMIYNFILLCKKVARWQMSSAAKGRENKDDLNKECRLVKTYFEEWLF